MPEKGAENYSSGNSTRRTTRSKKANPANSGDGPRSSSTLAETLRRALDAPVDSPGGQRRPRMTKREMMIRGLVDSSADGDLAATRLLLDMLRKADPRAVAAADEIRALGQDAVALLKERLARLACAETVAAHSADDPPSVTKPAEPDPPPADQPIGK